MTLALNPLQAALYARLTAQLAVPVYDFVPQGSAFPYVVLGEDTAIPWDTKTADGQEFTCTLHVWAKGAGRKDLKTAMQAVYLALHEREVDVGLPGLLLLRCEYAGTLQDPAQPGDTDHYFHGVMRFRALTRNP